MPGVGTTHHVEIGGHYYMLRPGSYLKKAAPQFGARFSTGDPDYNNLSIWQHWAQKCFIGGVDQDEWADDAMFDQGIGLDFTAHDKVVLSRDLARGGGSNWAGSSGTAAANAGSRAFTYLNNLYQLTFPTAGTEARLWRYDPGTDGWTRITSLDTKNIVARSVEVFDGKVFIGGTDVTTGLPKVIYDDGALTSWTTMANPSGVGFTYYPVLAMKVFQQKMYVAYGTRIWRMKNDQTWDGSTVFYVANSTSDSSQITAMEVHLGFLYMLSLNGHVHRTDGNSTFDIWNWDGHTVGVSIRSFDGRLFILTFEYTNTANVGWGCLYQMSGSAVTQLKRWGDGVKSTRIGNMTVYDRKMWYGASNLFSFGSRSGFGVACYDPIEDAHTIPVTNSDTVTYASGASPFNNYIVDDQIFFQGKLFVFVRGHGMFFTPYQYRDLTDPSSGALRRFDITSAGGGVGGTNGGWLTTSQYDAGTPGVKKLWRKIVVDCTILTSTSVIVEYSTNNGTSWTALAGITTVASRQRYEFFLNNVISPSLKLRVTLRSTSSLRSPTFYGYVVSYIPVPEPNWMWSFTIVLAEKPVLLDGTTPSVDTEAELNFLSTTYRTKQLVTFTDAEGFRWATDGSAGALIYDITFALRDLNQPLEGEVTITILEAVETY